MFEVAEFIDESVTMLKEKITQKAIIACSGGVDSSVVAVLLQKAIGDRLAEAAAEYLHQIMRIDNGDKNKYSLDELIKEKYNGIRPAHGYPAWLLANC